MIFVVLGTQKFQCNRLLKLMDNLIEQGEIEEPVFAQIGNSDYRPKNYQFDYFLEKEQFNEKIEECNLLITHSGVGTIISGMNLEKSIIVFPRLAKYNEHVDNHQLDIAEMFARKHFVLMCKEENEMLNLIQLSKKFKFRKYKSQRINAISTIEHFLETC